MKVLCVIPAGGGSKGAALQSVRLLAAKPLLAYTAESALAARHVSRAILSTDDEDVAEVGRRCGLDVPFLRPAGAVGGMPVLRTVQDAVRRLEEAGETCDAVCILDPASPFRGPEDIDRCIEQLDRTGADAVATVVPVPREYHPRAVWLKAADGSLRPAAPAAEEEPELPAAFRYDGSVYVARRDALMNAASLYGERVLGYVVDPARCVRLDQPEDWGRAERIARLGIHRATAGRIAPLAGPRMKLPAGWSAMPAAEPLAGAGVGPMHEGALASAAVVRALYLEPARKAESPRRRDSSAPFAVREALLPADCEVTAHETLDPTPPAVVAARSRSGATPAVRRIEDPFRAHPELLPDVRVSEAPLVTALAARRVGSCGLEAVAEPKRREIAGGSHPRPLGAPIFFSSVLGKAAARVRPVQPFVIGIAELAPPPKNRARGRERQAAPPELAPFAALPVQPASASLAARESLIQTPPFRREGRLLPRGAAAAIARVEIAETHPVELPGAELLAFDHRLAGVPPAVVRARTPNRAARWLARTWEACGRDPSAAAFGSIRPRAHGVEWPTARTFQFAHPPERPAKAGRQIKLDPRQPREFAAPAACQPASAMRRTRLRSAAAKRIAAPAIRPDKRTLASAAARNGGFPAGSGEPERRATFQAILRCALMPQAAFTCFDIEDHDDYGTWKRAPHCPASPAVPLVPDSGCDFRSRSQVAAAGCNVVFVGPYPGKAPERRNPHEIPLEPGVFLGPGRVDLMGMDFGAIAETSGSRWRISLKKTAGLFS
jgi:CMP-N-acetylneuraminic acid synthetase